MMSRSTFPFRLLPACCFLWLILLSGRVQADPLVVTNESPRFTLDTRLSGGDPWLSNLVVQAVSPVWVLDTRLSSPGSTLSNLIVTAVSPAFLLDTRLSGGNPLLSNLVVQAVSPALVLDTRLSTNGAPAGSIVMAVSPAFTLDTRLSGATNLSGLLVMVESPAFTLDTRLSAVTNSAGLVVSVVSPAFTLDTRLSAPETAWSNLIVQAVSPALVIDTRLSSPGSAWSNLVVSSVSPGFVLDTRLTSPSAALTNLIVTAVSPAFTVDTRLTPPNPLYAFLVVQATSAVFTVDTRIQPPVRTLPRTNTGNFAGKIRFSPDGLRLAKTHGTQALLWNLQTAQPAAVFSNDTATVDTAEFSPLGDQLLLGLEDGTARLADAATRQEIRRYATGNPYQRNPAAFAPDGARILTGGPNHTARLWSGTATNLLQTFSGHSGVVNAVALSPDGTQALTGSADKRAILWNVSTGTPLHIFTNHTSLLNAVGFSPVTNRCFTASSDGTIRVWDTTTGQQVLLIHQGRAVLDAAYSSDGRHLVSVNDLSPGSAFIWDAETGGMRTVFSDANAVSIGTTIRSVVLSPDDTTLATSHSDGAVRLWDTGLPPRSLHPLTLLPPGTNVPVTLRSHGLYYFEVNVEAARNLIVTLDATGGGNLAPRPKNAAAQLLSGTDAGLSSDATFANFGPAAPASAGANLTSIQNPPANADITAFRLTATKGHLPSVYEYEAFAQASVTNLHCEMPMALESSNKVYVLVFAPYLAAGTINGRISVVYDDFHLSSVTPNRGGNAGNLTLEIKGTGLETNLVVRLVKPSGQKIVGFNQASLSTVSLFATFNLTGQETGAYGIELFRPTDGASRTLSNAVQVTQGNGPVLRTTLLGPAFVRLNRTYQYEIIYENIGDADLPTPILGISSSLPNTLLNANNVPVSGSLSWLASVPNTPGSVLAPGQRGSQFVKVNGTGGCVLTVGPVTNESSAFDWEAVKQELKPAHISDSEWDAYWLPAISKVGMTRGEVERTLRSLSRDRWEGMDSGTMLRYALFLTNQSETNTNALGRHAFSKGGEVSQLYDAESDVKIIPAPGTSFDPNKATIVVTHGWGGTENEQRFIDLAHELSTTYPDRNVVRVTWEQGAHSPGWPWGASSKIPEAAEAALADLKAKGYSRWSDTTYVGESFGNGINAYMSSHAPEKGSALILNAANPAGYPIWEPNYSDDFRSSTAIQTRDLGDSPNKVGDRTILRSADCGNRPCNIWGESHTSNIDFLAEELRMNPAFAKSLIEGSLNLPDNGFALYDGFLTAEGQFYSDPSTFPGFFGLGYEIDRGFEFVGLSLLDVVLVRPIDPNDKIGPAGLGPNRVVSAGDDMEYMIRFENFHTATAPVQELIVVDYLDQDLDWTTVRFTEIAYGDRLITPPAHSQSFTIRDTPPTNSTAIVGAAVGDMVVEATASLNSQIGRLEWRVSAIDTNTSYFPQDALSGFLPPENGTGRGNGYVRFTVKPRATTPIGTGITNIASIVFDGNDAIKTPPVWNLVGDVPSLATVISYPPGSILSGMPFTYTLTLTNSGATSVTNVVLTNTLPAGMTVVNTSASDGTITVTNGILTWNLGTLSNGFGATVSFTFLPSQPGTFTNTISFSGGSGLAIFDSPSVITVLPAAPALGIRLVNGQVELFWPTNFSGFHVQKTSALLSSNQWIDLTNAPVIVGVEYRLTNGLPSGHQFYRLAKLVTDSPVPVLGIRRVGGVLELSWPTHATGYILESISSVTATNWASVLPAPSVVGDQNVVTNAISTESKFYRLRQP